MTDETPDPLATMFGILEGALMDRYLHIPPIDPKNTIDTKDKFSVSNNPDKDSNDIITTQAPRQVDQSTLIGHGGHQIAQKNNFTKWSIRLQQHQHRRNRESGYSDTGIEHE